jgi:hypothetical protein
MSLRLPNSAISLARESGGASFSRIERRSRKRIWPADGQFSSGTVWSQAMNAASIAS